MTLKRIQPATLKVEAPKVPKLPEVKLEDKAPDYLGQMNRMAAEAQKKQAQATSTLATATATLSAESLLNAVQSPAEKLTKEGRALIKEKKYAEARVPLGQAKKADPKHVPAYLFDAVACYHLRKDWEALENLAAIRQGPFPDPKAAELFGQVEDLVRKRVLPAVVEKAQELYNAKQHAEAYKILKRLLALDPFVPLYHVLYVVGHCSEGRWPEAMKAAEDGLRVCAGQEVGDLRRLRQQIFEQLLSEALEPAVGHYRDTQYGKARAVLAGLSPEMKAHPLWKTFDAYLVRLNGWLMKRSVAKEVPAGGPAEVEALYRLIVGREIQLAQLFLMVGQFDQADEILDQALALAPHFAYANFLRGLGIYRRMAALMGTPYEPGLADLVFQLKKARDYARKAVQHGSDAAPGFLAVLDQILADLERYLPPPEEIRTINQLIDEFGKAMALAEGGIQSVAHLDRIYNALQAVGKKCQAARRSFRSEPGLRTLAQLEEAVNSHCAQLAAIRAEVQDGETFMRLYKKFDDKMRAVNNAPPISTMAQLVALRTFFENLKAEAEAALARMTHNDARSQTAQLIDAIRNILVQLNPG